jgi:signal transduction histidine kinase
VANLLTNAVRHNVADGRVEVVTGAPEHHSQSDRRSREIKLATP